MKSEIYFKMKDRLTNIKGKDLKKGEKMNREIRVYNAGAGEYEIYSSKLDDPAMYILVNQDIKINKGKLAGQVGHAVATYFYRNKNNSILDGYIKEQKKIILYHSQKALEQLEKLGCISIRDLGYTDLKPNTLTCVNLGILDKSNIPSEYGWIKNLKLVR